MMRTPGPNLNPDEPSPAQDVSADGPRVFALSDVHADMKTNMAWMQNLSATAYQHDTLILAGDVSDNLATLHIVLSDLSTRFAHVCFVPGNHELWVRRQECPDSVAKFDEIMRLCDGLGVHTQPLQVGTSPVSQSVWIVPLFSWYVKPEEGPDSLFAAKAGEDPTLAMWSDNYFTKWPWDETDTPSAYFLRLNEARVTQPYEGPVISFSHFLPRAELIYSTPQELQALGVTSARDPHPTFNFSRVAGSTEIEAQIRRLGSITHVYGHQHRNRNRLIDGVRYVSHCLGYPREQQRWLQHGVRPADGPALIWPQPS